MPGDPGLTYLWMCPAAIRWPNSCLATSAARLHSMLVSIGVHLSSTPRAIQLHLVSADDVAAAILPNGEKVTAFIDTVSSLVKRNETIYSGELTYAERPGGKRKSRRFSLDLGKYRQTLIFSDELPRTLHELQAIPGKLDGIRDELQQIRRRLVALEHDPGSDTEETQ